MVDLKNELKNFLPISLENITKINSDIPEDIKNSILLYNNALEKLKMNSEDIAIIELKKAISLNPEFYEAINLLGLCYYYLKEYEKAEEMFEKVTKAENNGIRAFNYLRIMRNEETPDISQTKGTAKKSGVRKKVAKTREIKSDKVSIRGFSTTGEGKSDRKQDVIKYLTGIIIGIIIAFLIGIPSIFKYNNGSDVNNGDTDKGPAVIENNEYEEKYRQLSNEYENLKKDLEATKTERDYYKAAIKLYEVEDLAKARKYEEAADMLILIKNIEFKDAEKEKYDKLFNDIMPRASDIVYSQAYNLFQAKKYRESLNKYSKISEYYENYGKMDIVLYYMGKCYLELNDKENAKAMFLKTIEKFPDSEYARYSKSRVDSIIGNTENE